MGSQFSLFRLTAVACVVAPLGALCPAPPPPVNGDGQVTLRDFTITTPLFAANSAWNQRADEAAVLPASNQQILALYRVLLGDSSSLHPPGTGLDQPFPYMYVNHNEYSISVFRLGTEQQSVLMRDYWGNPSGLSNAKLPAAADGTVTVNAPAGPVRPSGPASTDADGHLVLYDPSNLVEYDYWNATTARGASGVSLGGGQTGSRILEAGAIDFFDVTGGGANAPGGYSARAMGTALLAGLILPEDVQSGEIRHALAFAIPGPRNTHIADPFEPLAADYFYPAATTETDFFSTDPLALAAGQRIRLKQTIVDDEGNTIDETRLTPITRMFLGALRDYGAYLVDNAGAFAFYAEDIHSANLRFSDAEVSNLIGRAAGASLSAGRTKWQLVMERLNEELERIPVAYSSQQNQNPATATFEFSNFDVVEPATVPSS